MTNTVTHLHRASQSGLRVLEPREELEDALRRLCEFLECAAGFLDELPFTRNKADNRPVLSAKTARLLQLQVTEAEKVADEARSLFYKMTA